ncbi:MAG: thiamine phosphate synthase [Armatimonadota bacterium]
MPDQPIDFRLYLITDRARTGGRPLVAALLAAAHAGVAALQLREKDLSPREQYALAAEVKAALGPLGTRVLINDRADIACAAGLAGVHLPSAGLSPAAARRCLPAGSLVAVSTHSLPEARFAEEFGADFITFGPVYPTPSKLAYGAPRGLEELGEVCTAVKIPVFALGGVTPARVAECLQVGAHGVAAIGALLDVPSIPDAVAAFLNELPA